MAEIGLFEAMYSARSLRRFKPDPVPDEVITKVLDAAIRAPSGSNQQSWEFVVIKDAAQRKKIGDVYRKAGEIMTALYTNRVKPAHMNEDAYRKLRASATYLIDHMADAPVLLIACLKQTAPAGAPPKLPPEVATAMKRQARISGSEHLSRRAEYYPRLSRTRSRHSDNDGAHLFRGRGEGDSGAAARSADVRADADRISAGEVRTDQAPARERGRVPGQVRQSLEELSAARFSEAIEEASGYHGASFLVAKHQFGSSRRSSLTLPARCRTWSCCESNDASTAGSGLPRSRYASAACANRS